MFHILLKFLERRKARHRSSIGKKQNRGFACGFGEAYVDVVPQKIWEFPYDKKKRRGYYALSKFIYSV